MELAEGSDAAFELRSARCWPTHSSPSAAWLPPVRLRSVPLPRSRGCRAAGGGRAFHRTWLVLRWVGAGDRATWGARPTPRPPCQALLAEESEHALRLCTGRTDSCARCCICEAIYPARSHMAALPWSSRKSAEARSLGSRPRRSRCRGGRGWRPRPRPRVCSSEGSRSLAQRRTALWYEPRIWRRSRTRGWPPVTARSPRAPGRGARAVDGDGAGGLAPSTSR